MGGELGFAIVGKIRYSKCRFFVVISRKVPNARIIHSFGRADELDREELVRLCRSIARVYGLTVIDPLADSRTARRRVVLPSDISIIRTVELGTPLMVEAIWERLGIGKTFRRVLKKNKLRVAYDQALLAMTANRLCERQRRHRHEIVRMLEEELGKHPDKSATAQWAIELLASRRFK